MLSRAQGHCMKLQVSTGWRQSVVVAPGNRWAMYMTAPVYDCPLATTVHVSLTYVSGCDADLFLEEPL